MAITPATTGLPASEPLTAEEMAAWRAFHRATVQVNRKLEADLQAGHRLSLAAYGVLVDLSEAPGQAVRMSVLADDLGLTRSAITRLVDKLVADGLVRRTTCPSDARGSLAELTPAGLDALRTAYPTHLASVRRHVFDRLAPRQVTDIASALAALTDARPCAVPEPCPDDGSAGSADSAG